MDSIWDNIKEFLVNIFHNLGWAWWVEIGTQNPSCTYYFGPFLSSQEANASVKGYIEDLEMEGAQGIVVNIKRCKPEKLTIADDLGERFDLLKKPIFSGQM